MSGAFPIYAAIGTLAFGAGCAFGNKFIDRDGHLKDDKLKRETVGTRRDRDSAWDTARERGRSAKNTVEDDAESAWERTKDRAHDAKEGVKDIAHDTKESFRDTFGTRRRD